MAYRKFITPIEPFPADVDREAFGHWLSGFCDGESCFRLSALRHKKYPACLGLSATFSIDIRADDRKILELIQSYWQCGKIRHRFLEPRKDGTHSHPQAMYYITYVPDLHKNLIPHFNRFPLRAKKARDFLIWERGVKMLYQVSVRQPGSHRRKWLPGEKEEYVNLTLALKRQRLFNSNSIELPPLPRKEKGLFD